MTFSFFPMLKKFWSLYKSWHVLGSATSRGFWRLPKSEIYVLCLKNEIINFKPQTNTLMKCDVHFTIWDKCSHDNAFRALKNLITWPTTCSYPNSTEKKMSYFLTEQDFLLVHGFSVTFKKKRGQSHFSHGIVFFKLKFTIRCLCKNWFNHRPKSNLGENH